MNANKHVGSWELDLLSARWGLAMCTFEQSSEPTGFVEGGDFFHVLSQCLLIALN